jgi:putative protein-disulfide isomerase
MKIVIILIVGIMINLNGLTQDKGTIIYIGDPMCSWCYGFAPEISKVKAHFETQLDFRVVMGGLRPYNNETMTDLGDFLKHHWEEVSQRSGQPFGYGILEDTSFVYDTEPASRAVVVMRNLKPEAEFDFFKMIQTAFYLENKNTNEVATYLPLAASYGVSEREFEKAFESEEMKEKVKEDFRLAQQLGVRGFPSVVLELRGNYILVANGYTTSVALIDSIQKTIDNQQ